LLQTGLPNAVSIGGYNANNQLTTWGTANLSYGLNGNMTSDGRGKYHVISLQESRRDGACLSC